ncbi:trimeric intracellular cation channel family protein [Gaetbulibacter saemankumensis]|uniref:trimeric intracellular cation channel family protein n=1 Tax=Gaetbulibacter saemankumensis TaxID=311208 RepID=UPI000550EF3A|nr:trimeric intracellular cation channel family protein [Gaetbulibacter saemankumensis]
MLYLIDILGTIAFTISGALVAINKRMDAFGVFIIASVTAVGGGTLRDVLIGSTPVVWMQDMTYIYLIVISTIFAIIARSKIDFFRTSLFLFDTIGIGLYTLIGVEKGVTAGLHPIICIALGVMSACFGGVIRDILCNEIPVLFRKEIYAIPCLLGGVTYFVLELFPIPDNLVFLVSGGIVIVTRLLAVKFHIALPIIAPKS